MSWHYLQEGEEASWAVSSLDGAPSALLKLMPMQDQSCLQDKKTKSSNRSLSGMILKQSTDIHGMDSLMWFQGDSLVKTSRPQESVREYQVNVLDCGQKWPVSSLKFNPDTLWWKTQQCLFPEDLMSSWLILPRWGMMQDGECSRLPMLEHYTGVRESGSLPTPLPTPTADDSRQTYKKEYEGFKNMRKWWMFNVGGLINPCFVEKIMGWPIGWTDLNVLEMGKFQQWLSWHGKP